MAKDDQLERMREKLRVPEKDCRGGESGRIRGQASNGEDRGYVTGTEEVGEKRGVTVQGRKEREGMYGSREKLAA